MTFKTILRAGFMALAVVATTPVAGSAEILRILDGVASGTLAVATNRAVVVESEEPFAELSIANPGIADISTLSDRTIYVLGKAPGRTTLTLLGADGRLITNVDVQVSPDTAEFKERLEQIIPGEAIEVRTANDGIVLSGTVSSTARLDRALDLAERYAPGRVSNLMTVGGRQQVMLQVRFAEVNRNVSKQLSANLDFSGSIFGGDVTLDIDSVLPPPTTGGFSTFNWTGGALAFELWLDALENKGLTRTLAEPNLVALSGQQAKFLAGGEIPIPVVDGEGRLTITYKPFGVELQFTPVVVDGSLINLQIDTAVSALDETETSVSADIIVNGFTRREASTTVEMRDGQSFAIAGLLEDDFGDGVAQIPWLGDLPVLGALFRSTQFQRSQSELVIIITPHLVSPTSGQALVLPTDRISVPTESALFLNGNLAGPGGGGAAGEVAKQDFSGSYGYVME